MSARFITGVGAGAIGCFLACSSYDSAPAPADGGGVTTDAGALGDGGSSGQITTAGGVSITPSAVSFHRVPCGMQQSQAIVVKNDGNATAVVDVSLDASDVFSLPNAVGPGIHLELAAHQQTSFTLQAKSDKAGAASTDLNVKVDGEDHDVAVSLDTVGGSLALDPASIDFGVVKVGTASAKQSVVFRNDGNDPISVAGFTPSSSFQISGLPFDIAAGATIAKDVQMVAGTAGSPLTETLSAQAQGLCGAASTLTLKGQRLDAAFTVNPSSVDFGNVNCGAASPAAKTVTVTNYTTTAQSFTMAFAKNPSPFTATSSVGVVPASSGGSPGIATIMVSLPAPGQSPGTLSDVLSVNVDGVTTAVALRTVIRGAVLEVDRKTITLAKNANATAQLTLSNKGNVDVCVKYARSKDQFVSEALSCYAGGCSITDDTDSVPAGISTTWTVRYNTGNGSLPTVITAQPIGCGNGPFTPAASVAPLCGVAPTVTVTPSN